MHVDLIGYAGIGAIMLSKWAIAHKHRWGWLTWCAGAGAWIYVGVVTDITSLYVGNIIFSVQYLYGWYKWGKDGT